MKPSRNIPLVPNQIDLNRRFLCNNRIELVRTGDVSEKSEVFVRARYFF